MTLSNVITTSTCAEPVLIAQKFAASHCSNATSSMHITHSTIFFCLSHASIESSSFVSFSVTYVFSSSFLFFFLFSCFFFYFLCLFFLNMSLKSASNAYDINRGSFLRFSISFNSKNMPNPSPHFHFLSNRLSNRFMPLLMRLPVSRYR